MGNSVLVNVDDKQIRINLPPGFDKSQLAEILAKNAGKINEVLADPPTVVDVKGLQEVAKAIEGKEIDLSGLIEATSGIAKGLSSISEKEVDLSGLVDILSAISKKEFSTEVTNQINFDATPLVKSLTGVLLAIREMPDSREEIKDMTAAVKENTEALGRLEAAARATRTITYNERGKIESVTVAE